MLILLAPIPGRKRRSFREGGKLSIVPYTSFTIPELNTYLSSYFMATMGVYDLSEWEDVERAHLVNLPRA